MGFNWLISSTPGGRILDLLNLAEKRTHLLNRMTLELRAIHRLRREVS
jgi:hypothetical protein